MDLKLWLGRLRKRLGYGKIRYYAVGEYGDHTFRPHYHAAVFGLGVLDSAHVTATWSAGFSLVGDLTPASAHYIAGYVTKKMTHASHPLLKGRYPEFARMSLKPGIGATALGPIADVLTGDWGPELVEEGIPCGLRQGKKMMPLGRYLRGKLREKVGDPEAVKAHESKVHFVRRLQEVEEAKKDFAAFERKEAQRALNYVARVTAKSKGPL